MYFVTEVKTQQNDVEDGVGTPPPLPYLFTFLVVLVLNYMTKYLFFFLILAPFYQIIVGVADYCCTSSNLDTPNLLGRTLLDE